MTIGLDTSFVMRLLTGQPEDQAAAALRFLGARIQLKHTIIVSDLVVAEIYYALQYHYELTKKEALDALRRFLATPGIAGLGEAAEILAITKLASAKPGFIDRVIHAGYLRSGAEELITFEKATGKLSGVRVLGS